MALDIKIKVNCINAKLVIFIAVLMAVSSCSPTLKNNESNLAETAVFISLENHLSDPQIYDSKKMLWGTEHRMFPFEFCSTQSKYRCILMEGGNVKLAWPRDLDFKINSEWKYGSMNYLSEPFELGLECDGDRSVKFVKLIATNQEHRAFYVISSTHKLVMMGAEYLPDQTLLGPEIAKREKEALKILQNEKNVALTPTAVEAYKNELNKDHSLGLRRAYIASTNCGLFVP